MRTVAEIAALADAATKGPWTVENLSDDLEWPELEVVTAHGVNVERVIVMATGAKHDVADCDFIAAAREDVPWLLGEVARLRDLLGAVVANYRRAGWCECSEHWDKMPYPHRADCVVVAATRELLDAEPRS